ncbi:glycoside hydrolase family 2 protein [Paenibacillus tarimensis]
MKIILDDWKFKACQETEWLPAKVPGCVHTDLLQNGRIPDPFYGTNERDLQWIDKKDWEYMCRFDVSEELLASSNLELVFDGLDTYADVFVNDKLVLSADNMFRIWKVDVKDHIQQQNNTIRIRFRSPIREDLPKLEKLGYALPASNDQSEHGGVGDKRVSVFARKAPYHYGWDWGPRFVTSGIWREAKLEGWNCCRITDLFIEQKEVTADKAKLAGTVEIQSERNWTGTLKIAADGMEWQREVHLIGGTQSVQLELSIDNPKLWWSRGLGEPHMYTFKAELLEDGASVHRRSVRSGLRSVRLIREKDERGTSFYIELNGVPVFAKGANHIPNDSFVTEVTRERYLHEIATAAESNMNMLRVWGGGIYEADDFYELCDEYGILVWQDFMFACSMYPGDEAFLRSVSAEAEDNVKRLRNHPSIVLWCGNNEIDTAWSHYDEDKGWGWKKEYPAEIRERIWADYETIFHRLLPEVVNRLAPGMPYWPSSPMTGLTGDKEQHSSSSSTSGDIHYWGVWHAVEPIENYNIYVGRFMSEYGFQSFPEYKTVRTYAEESDLELESEVMSAHQRNPRGNGLIKEYMDMYLPEPKDFPSFLYMSQILQAEAMKMAIEAHRRNKTYCMGTLYWQINDCWPVASWAGVDYLGRWKAMQYYAKRSFRDVMLSIDGTTEGVVDFHLVTDLLSPVSGTLHLKLLDFNGAVLKELSQPVQMSANGAGVVHTVKTEELLSGSDPRTLVLLATLESEGAVVDSKEHYFVPAKELKLGKPDINIKVEEDGAKRRYTLETDRLAKQVWISSEAEGVFSDNYFDLIPGMPVTVAFLARHSDGQPFVPANPGKIEVRSMADFIK